MNMIWFFLIGLSIGTTLAFGGFIKSKKMMKDLKKNMKDKCELKIAVIIAAKNEEVVIEKTVRSVLNNSLKNLRLIVVDDGSTDDTVSILKKLEKEYPRLEVMFNNKNPGKSEALNTALENVDEDLVLLLDADARINEQYLLNNCLYFNNASVDAIFTNFEPYNLKHNITFHLQELYFSFSKAMLYSGLITKGMFMNSGIFFRKTILDRVGEFDPNTLVDDFDIAIKLWKINANIKFALEEKCKIQYSPTVKSLFHQHSRWYMGGTRKAVEILKRGNILGLFVLLLVGGLALIPAILLVLSLILGFSSILPFFVLFLTGMYSVSVFSYLLFSQKNIRGLLLNIFINPVVLYVFFQITVLISFFKSFSKSNRWFKVPRDHE
jgi:1,2-diacylglycerol 3-beta-glucosyltransferase